ncbi:hypothetical protein HV824_02455 [Myxococcus sp. AM009]|uniref:hypothetical protein n=1 Tax=unclassified Myxococcus TaxID=2648731 RepID=UPI001594F87A|nr:MULTISPECIES: hypothetical protein [unclassified Myxococcus]NVI96985.1 hypothetical protein [Myxococcus sp. AM009]NVJ12808.1 hypothetical protein [Myxococcus sp. AM010]
MSPNLVLASTVLLLAFVHLSVVDGVYLHLWRYRLHAREESRHEHWLHTARAVLFPPILATLFLAPPRGVVLWFGLALVALDQVVELFDTFSERDSRAALGGLSSFEYSLHVVLTTLRVGALALALAAVPPEAWSPWAPSVPGQAHPAFVRAAVEFLLPGAIVAAVVHLWLGCKASAQPACRWTRAWARMG